MKVLLRTVSLVVGLLVAAVIGLIAAAAIWLMPYILLGVLAIMGIWCIFTLGKEKDSADEVE